MLTNLRILKYGLWIQDAVDKITNNYFTGTVKEITKPRVPLTNLDLNYPERQFPRKYSIVYNLG